MDYIETVINNNNTKEIQKTPSTGLRIIDTEVDSAEGSPVVKQEKTVSRKQLASRLNHINFLDQRISINFEHLRDKRVLTFKAKPQICFGKRLICLWDEKSDIHRHLDVYRFRDCTLTNDEGIIIVNASLRGISSKGICVNLPETFSQATARRAQRHTCNDLSVHVVQNSIIFDGTLIDFSPFTFHVEIISKPDQPLQWINLNDKINLIVSTDKETLYSGECKILKQTGGFKSESIILEPIADNVQRFNPKIYRSDRLKLSPSPNIIFKHPFTHKSINLKVIDISGSGVCVEDNEENSVLLPGMILPSLTIAFTIDFFFKCRAQVIYRKSSGTDSQTSQGKCGIAFLDMNPNDHMRLLSILHQTKNKNLYICTDIDMDDLWDFFFKTGFLYPKKYAFIQKNKIEIKRTYEKLYKGNSNISRHLTWHNKGVVLGHLALLRFYENTWMIHHLAALKSDQQLKIGVEILKHIGSFTYDSHKLFSSHMAYLICYFRSENSFPSYFFGGVAQRIQNPTACSVDSFAYLYFRKPADYRTGSDDSWKLSQSEYEDMVELESFYERESGGVMIRALDLSPDKKMIKRHDLADEYRKMNLMRKRLIFSLKQDKFLKAVIMVNVSDFALNLSDLTRCITVFVIDQENLTIDRIYWAATLLSAEYMTKKFPILIYPVAYADRQKISYERTYNLWALDGRYSDDYFKHMEFLLKPL
jgi:hypothetical protein